MEQFSPFSHFHFGIHVLSLFSGRTLEAIHPAAIETQASGAFTPHSILHSKEDKPPKGFEKFFKRDSEKKSATKKKDDDKKDSKETKKEQEEADLTEEEEAAERKSKEGDKESDGGSQGKIKAFFFDPNNNPKNEALVLMAAILGAGYFVYNFKAPMKEIVYMEFLNDYLL